MPSRMEKYYTSNEIKRRTAKNQDLYKSIYEEAEYSNVEGISLIEKNDKIDIDKIYELLNSAKNENSKKEYVSKQKLEPKVEEEIKNYDILDILSKAKSERPETELSNTKYNILKGINLNDNYSVPPIDNTDLKSMIETISNNSKNDKTSDLLDDLKTIHDTKFYDAIKNEESKPVSSEIDKSFYTSSLSFTDDDFEQIKDNIDKNNKLTKVLIFILSVIIVTGIMVLIYLLVK